MINEIARTGSLFDVVVNDEGQYSIWTANKLLPLGWRKIGMLASKEACLQYISETWVEMRPLSLQRLMVPVH